MDEFLSHHLHAWLEYHFDYETCQNKFEIVASFVDRYPDVISDGYAWEEILRMAERKP